MNNAYQSVPAAPHPKAPVSTLKVQILNLRHTLNQVLSENSDNALDVATCIPESATEPQVDYSYWLRAL